MANLSRYPDLVLIPNTQLPVYYSPGTEQRASAAAARCERAHRFLGAALETRPEVTVLVLAPEHWPRYATYPLYGMPHYPDDHTLAVAGLDAAFWRSLSPPVEVLPADAGRAIEAAYGRPDGSTDLARFFDLLVVHEMGHLFLAQAGRSFPRLWLLEFFCNLGLHAYVARTEPDQLAALETFPAVMAGRDDPRFRHRSLEAFERLYLEVGPENYGWYQCRLHAAAKRVYEAGGMDALRRLWDTALAFSRGISDEQLAARLHAEVHPELARVLTTWPT
jgi:hypothetical protein